MNFPTSTHKREWLFDPETLNQKYAAAQQQALEVLRAASDDTAAAADGAAPDAKKQRADCPVSVADEAALKLFYQVKLKAICEQLKMPSKVLHAALLFFKRFYVASSCLEHDPMRVMPTAIYLACKVEEAYRSAESLAKAIGIEAGPVLRFEVPLLQGLKFDLVLHSPYRALAGLFKELDELRSQQSPLLDPQLLAAPPEAVDKARGRARAAADSLLLTDAPLLHAPGVIAAAALRSAFRKLQLPCHQFLRHVAQRGMQQQMAASAVGGRSSSSSNGGNGSLDAAAAEQQLLASMAAVDDLAVRQGQIDEAALQQKATDVDRIIKLWKKGLQQQQRSDSKGGSVPPPAVGAAAAAGAMS
uniref:Cyclin-like domain-containing protein n=1 Tax=Tetradesmus obliquus TaxID=3088 RepID=A0A383VC47_TETOB|eukprot:jgi/Sobl393_1/13798/SZX78917.1